MLFVDEWRNQAYSRLSSTHGHITDCKLLVCMYWTRLVLVRPATSLYSASPLKHHTTGKQWCLNPDHYADSEPARRSLTLLCWALSRAAEPQILFGAAGDRNTNLPHARRTLSHYTTRPGLVFVEHLHLVRNAMPWLSMSSLLKYGAAFMIFELWKSWWRQTCCVRYSSSRHATPTT